MVGGSQHLRSQKLHSSKLHHPRCTMKEMKISATSYFFGQQTITELSTTNIPVNLQLYLRWAGMNADEVLGPPNQRLMITKFTNASPKLTKFHVVPDYVLGSDVTRFWSNPHFYLSTKNKIPIVSPLHCDPKEDCCTAPSHTIVFSKINRTCAVDEDALRGNSELEVFLNLHIDILSFHSIPS